MNITIPERNARTLMAEVKVGQTFLHNNKLYLKIDEVYDAKTLNNEIDEFHDIRQSDDIEAAVYQAINLENGCLSSFHPSTGCELVEVDCIVKHI